MKRGAIAVDSDASDSSPAAAKEPGAAEAAPRALSVDAVPDARTAGARKPPTRGRPRQRARRDKEGVMEDPDGTECDAPRQPKADALRALCREARSTRAPPPPPASRSRSGRSQSPPPRRARRERPVDSGQASTPATAPPRPAPLDTRAAGCAWAVFTADLDGIFAQCWICPSTPKTGSKSARLNATTHVTIWNRDKQR